MVQLEIGTGAEARTPAVRKTVATSSLSLAALIAAGALMQAEAQTIPVRNWTGAVNSDWANAGNWSPAGVPSATHNAIVNKAPAAEISGGNVLINRSETGVGNGAVGQLTVRNGAKLEVGDPSGPFFNGGMRIGGDGGSGTLIVTGAGSSVAAADVELGMSISGQQGGGTLRVEAGGLFRATDVRAGGGADSTANILVSGAGSTLRYADDFIVGATRGSATLRIENGGRIDNDGPGRTGTFNFVGLSGAATVAISGAGSAWVAREREPTPGFPTDPAQPMLIIGFENTAADPAGSGAVILSDGGLLQHDRGVSLAGIKGNTFDPTQGSRSSGQVVIGAAEGQTPAAAGRMQAPWLWFGPGSGQLVFNHTGNPDGSVHVFDTPLQGSGTVRQLAGPTSLTGDNGAFTGVVSVYGGNLSVDGQLGPAGSQDGVSVHVWGGSLSGRGTIGGRVSVYGDQRGVLEGRSGQTLTIGGRLAFLPGAGLNVALGEPSDVPLIVTQERALIGGIVNITEVDGQLPQSYNPCGTGPTGRYTLINAAGGVTGRFAGMSANFAYLTPTLSYDANNAYLSLRGNSNGAIDFASAGGSRNQRAAASGVQGLDCSSPIYAAIAVLDAPQARAAFSALSGEIHASAKSALIEDSGSLRASANDRLRAAFGFDGGGQMAVMSYGFTADKGPSATGPMPRSPATDRFAVWGQGFGSWGRIDGDGNAARSTRSTGGALVGADVALFDTLRVGALAGYSHSRFDVSARLSSGESDNYHLGLYGGGQWGGLGLRLGASYTWHEIDTRRTVAFPGFSDSLRGDYRAGTAQAFGELGYRFAIDRVALEPFAGLAYAGLRSEGFSERGGAAALAVRGSSTNVGFSTLGLRASASLPLGGADLTLRGTLAWRHAFGDVTPQALASLVGGGSFVVGGVPIARNAALVEAGLDLALGRGMTLGLSYTGQLAQDAQDHGVKGTLAVKF